MLFPKEPLKVTGPAVTSKCYDVGWCASLQMHMKCLGPLMLQEHVNHCSTSPEYGQGVAPASAPTICLLHVKQLIGTSSCHKSSEAPLAFLLVLSALQLPATGSFVMIKTLPLTACGAKEAHGSSAVCAGSLMAHEGLPYLHLSTSQTVSAWALHVHVNITMTPCYYPHLAYAHDFNGKMHRKGICS